MPAGFVHGDTAQQLITPLTLLERGHFVVNSKKTFLTPLLYSISALAHIPVLYFAAAVQHLVGVLLVVVTSLLAKAWFASWRLWIVPLTVLIAINPTLLWYEHAALPESLAVLRGRDRCSCWNVVLSLPEPIHPHHPAPRGSVRGERSPRGTAVRTLRTRARAPTLLGRLVRAENLRSSFQWLGDPDFLAHADEPERHFALRFVDPMESDASRRRAWFSRRDADLIGLKHAANGTITTSTTLGCVRTCSRPRSRS